MAGKYQDFFSSAYKISKTTRKSNENSKTTRTATTQREQIFFPNGEKQHAKMKFQGN